MSIEFEASFLRAAVLVGLVHEREVPAWAEARLLHGEPGDQAGGGGRAKDTRRTAALGHLLLVPVELSPIRAALEPLAERTPSGAVEAALLRGILLFPGARSRGSAHRVKMLELLGEEGMLRPGVARAAKEFGDEIRLAAAGVGRAEPPTDDDLDAWLRAHSLPHRFRVPTGSAEGASAFVAALSRQVGKLPVRDDTTGPTVWFEATSEGAVLLDEEAWLVATQVFEPLPAEANIPHATEPGGALGLVLARGTTGLGMDQAVALRTDRT